MTLRTRDHLDLVDSHIAFHLAAGVDFVIANDHRSRDGTREVLESFERAGVLRLIRRDGERFDRGWVNEMARLAACEHGADWVFHSDADEFWWPRGGDLKAVLGAVPERFGIIRGIWRHFPPRTSSAEHFAERMIVRMVSRGAWSNVEHTFHPHVKVLHRADPEIRLSPGAHDAETRLAVLRSWFPIDVLHFPLRTRAQAEAKYRLWEPVLAGGTAVASHVDSAVGALRAGGFDDFYERYVVDDAALEAGLGRGTLTLDLRLRNALRRLAGDVDAPLSDATEFPTGAPDTRALDFPRLDLAEEGMLADDVACLTDAIERARDRVDRIDRRLDALERLPGRRMLRRLGP